MIRHHKTDSERKRHLQQLRANNYTHDGLLGDGANEDEDGLLDIIENLLERVRMLEAREGTDRQ